MKLLIVSAVLAATFLAGCSSGGGDAPTPEQDAQGRYVIHMTAGNRFTPADAQVPVGATVVWVNDGSVHDVTAEDGSWESPRYMPVGASYERKFDTAGTFEYQCDLHSSQGMTGILRVEGDGPTSTSRTTSSTSATTTVSASASVSPTLTPSP